MLPKNFQIIKGGSTMIYNNFKEVIRDFSNEVSQNKKKIL